MLRARIVLNRRHNDFYHHTDGLILPLGKATHQTALGYYSLV